MSDTIPVPEIKVYMQKLVNEESGRARMNITIEAEVEGYSNGILFLDDLPHIFLLKEAIDSFIEKHNLKPEQFS